MLNYNELIEGVDKKYWNMLGQVDIPNFMKCMAQYSGIPFKELKSEYLKEILLTWATNKYEYWKMLGNRTRVDYPFEYEDTERSYVDRWYDFATKYPKYGAWAAHFNTFRINKIEYYDLSWNMTNMMSRVYRNVSVNGMKITRFFENCLGASPEEVTAVAAIYENQLIKATYTISIDPVDMMLGSENPYDWKSCYRLEHMEDSHADGCAAAMVDTSSLITYIWNEKGKLDLYRTYELKDVRYKRMRQWISISPNMTAIHFNSIYPSRPDRTSELAKSFRRIPEEIVAAYKGLENNWEHNDYYYDYDKHKSIGCTIEMGFSYGYTEFDECKIYKIKGAENESWTVYDTPVICLCCGQHMEGTYGLEEDEKEYNGEGLVCSNITEKQGHWCEYAEEWCRCEKCSWDNCEGCGSWEYAHPLCDLTDEPCPEEQYAPDIYDGIAHSDEDSCANCPHWIECHKKDNEDEE